MLRRTARTPHSSGLALLASGPFSAAWDITGPRDRPDCGVGVFGLARQAGAGPGTSVPELLHHEDEVPLVSLEVDDETLQDGGLLEAEFQEELVRLVQLRRELD